MNVCCAHMRATRRTLFTQRVARLVRVVSLYLAVRHKQITICFTQFSGIFEFEKIEETICLHYDIIATSKHQKV